MFFPATSKGQLKIGGANKHSPVIKEMMQYFFHYPI